MKSIVILGAGNVAFHLTRALLENTFNVRQIFNRTLHKAKELGEANNIAYTDKISELEEVDLYIIASSDSSIEELSYCIPHHDTLVVHTSGSSSINLLKGEYRKGVIYPLQTFTKSRFLRYVDIPFFIEAEHKSDEEKLFKLCSKISNEVHVLDERKRMMVQMSGVWVNNFVNHLYYIGEQFCEENGLPFNILRPIIKETAEKTDFIMPYNAQTGPAIREDEVIIQKHLNEMKDPHLAQLYKLLTKSIQKVYIKDENIQDEKL